MMKEYGVEASSIKQYCFRMQNYIHDLMTMVEYYIGERFITDNLKCLIQYGNHIFNNKENLVPIDSKERSRLISFDW